MSIDIVIKVDAGKALDFLGRMPRKLEDALDTGIKKSAAFIEGESKRVTPVDTGRLRASIHSIFSRLRGEVGTNTNYAVYVHEGTRFMRARPFMSWGFRNAESEIRSTFKDEVKRALQ